MFSVASLAGLYLVNLHLFILSLPFLKQAPHFSCAVLGDKIPVGLESCEKGGGRRCIETVATLCKPARLSHSLDLQGNKQMALFVG